MTACFECGAPADHHHHVVPRSLGGTKTVPLCGTCHSRAHGLAGETWTEHRTLTRAALGVKRARGERVGELPLGRTIGADGVALITNPVEAAAINEVKRLRAEGLSVRGIADELNRRGVPARGERWHATTVQRLVRRGEA
jgi:hypothetical protein